MSTTQATIRFAPADSRYPFRLKDPVSALTHYIGCILAILGTPILLIHAAQMGNGTDRMICMSIFMLSMIMLYGASASYHAFDISQKANIRLRKLDHMMIYFLIAGTYTPYCYIAVGGAKGIAVLTIEWTIALIGLLINLFWINKPKWLSSLIYIAMGWICLFVMPDFFRGLNTGGFVWLLLGGLFYTVGGVIYALKLKCFKNPAFGGHELFHLFIMAGSACHYISVGWYMTLL